MVTYPNGDFLIGDSFLGPLMNDRQNGKVVMTRLDPCGNKLWAYSYSLSSGYLELRDMYISPSEEILAYGSYFNGEEELIFLLNLRGSTGGNAEFSIYDPKTTNGYFAYSLNYSNNNFVIYGYLVSPNTGFVGYLDESFNPLWSKKLDPFEANGASIIDKTQHIVARSGKFLFKLDETGEFVWTRSLNIPAVNGPFETIGGYIFVGHDKGFSFFFKVDENGALVWKSDQFPAIENSGAITRLNNNDMLFTYNCPDENSNHLCQLTFTNTGEILEQEQLQLDVSINSGLLSQSIDDFNQMTIVGNANSFVSDQADIKDFILQYSRDFIGSDCFSWTGITTTTAHTTTLNLSPLDMKNEDFDLKLVEQSTAIVDTFLYPSSDICKMILDPLVSTIDTILPCGENWIVSLPDVSYRWLDGLTDNPRLLTESGLYKARNNDCEDPREIIFGLKKEECQCKLYIPNAFTPNGDGVNDMLSYFHNCSLDEVQLSIFNRAGYRVFHSSIINQFWDGTFGGQNAEVGVYVILIEYQWTNQEGRPQNNSITSDITLIR